MLKTILLVCIFAFQLFSFELQSVYFVDSKEIKLKDIVLDAKTNIVLYKIDKNRYTKKIKTTKLLKLLEKHGYNSYKSSSRYVRFVKKSPIDTSKIESDLAEIYQENYPNITIKDIIIIPRGYISALPNNYNISVQSKAHLSKEGTLSIKTVKNKKIFFDYIVNATVSVYFSKGNLQKWETISALNTIKKSIVLDRFRTLPISIAHLNVSQSKRNLKAKKILTVRDIQTLHLVKKNANVNVHLKDGNLDISFLAKALQNGRLNDIITVKKRNQERLRVRIIGKNMVELK